MTVAEHYEKVRQAARFVQAHERFFIASHIRPDSDALGSSLALMIFLRQLGKTATVYNEDFTPYNLHFLFGADEVVHEIPADIKSYDAVVIVDSGEIRRVGRVFNEYYAAHPFGKILCIDHHVSNDGFGQLNLIIPDATSCAEIIAALIQSFRHPFTSDVATNLLCGISGDTGSFKYDSTSAQTFYLAANLVEAGAQPGLISQELYEKKPRHYFHLFSDVLSTFEMHEKLPVAWMRVDYAMLEKYGFDMDVTEDMVEEIRSLNDVEVAVFFKQNASKNGYKLSVRSKSYFDVAELCSRFGGGGHARASGADMEGDYEDIRRAVIHEIESDLIIR